MSRAKRDLIEVPRQRVLCQCVAELISPFIRPYLFRVTVQGLPPHAQRRVYEVTGDTEELAATKAMDIFSREMSSPRIMEVYTPAVWR
jgi:hypothetical protein